MIINTDLVYPIGSIYLSVNATNPSKYFGGTWEQITGDAYLKIVNNELDAGKYAGTSSEHKIPVESIPAHNHKNAYAFDSGKGASSPINGTLQRLLYNPANWYGANTASTGGGQAYYPYYYGICVWKRVA